jgi:hypothetical protein
MVHPCGAGNHVMLFPMYDAGDRSYAMMVWGIGAIGHFKVTKDVSDLTCAGFLENGKTTPVSDPSVTDMQHDPNE